MLFYSNLSHGNVLWVICQALIRISQCPSYVNAFWLLPYILFWQQNILWKTWLQGSPHSSLVPPVISLFSSRALGKVTDSLCPSFFPCPLCHFPASFPCIIFSTESFFPLSVPFQSPGDSGFAGSKKKTPGWEAGRWLSALEPWAGSVKPQGLFSVHSNGSQFISIVGLKAFR